MKTLNELELAQELIRFPTIKTEDKGIMKFLSKKLSTIGFNCRIIKSKGTDVKPALNLYARIGKSKPHLNYLGHTDVVSNLNGWKIPPFKGLVRKGNLNGRGAQDMKGGVACFISAISKFLAKKKLKGSISIIISADEETTGLGTPAVMKYLRKKNEKIDFSIVGEPTSNNFIGDEIRIGRRGSMNGIITVYGKSGHAAFKNFINPCTAMAKIISKLKSSSLDNGTKFMPPSNLEFTKINVDNLSENVVPHSANAKFNVRFNTKYESSSLKRKLNKIINSTARKEKCKVKIEYKLSGEAFYTQPNKNILMVKKIVKEITGNSPKLNCRGGTSDSRFLGKIPRLELGLRNNTIHQIDEKTSVSDLRKLTKIYTQILQNYFK